MTKNEYGTICLNLGFMSGMFFAASGDMPDEFARASNIIRAICSWQIAENNVSEGLPVRVSFRTFFQVWRKLVH